MRKSILLPILYSVLAVIFWGFSFVWVKIVFKQYNPITVVTLRLILSSLLLFIIYIFNPKREKILKKDIPILFLLAFCEPFMYFLGESFGLNRVSSSLGSIIISTIPVFTPVFAFFILKEKLSFKNYLGLFLSFIGVLIIVLKPSFSSSGFMYSDDYKADIEGILLMLLAVISAIFYTIVLKKVSERYNALTIVMLQNSIGIIYFLPLFFMFDWQKFLQISPNTETITAFFELSIFASILAFYFYIHAVKQLGVTKASAFTNLIPVVTLLAASYLIHEQITFNTIIGMIIVLSGVFVSQLKEKILV